MRFMTARKALILSTTVLLVMAASTAAIASSGERPMTERPVTERLDGQATGITYADPADILVVSHFDGRCEVASNWVSSSRSSGHVTHLGHVTATSEHCFQLATGTFGEARVVIRSANGDQLTATYEGAMTGPNTFSEETTITGGTGRFARASGTIFETGWFDPATGRTGVTGEGWISYDASDRSR